MTYVKNVARSIGTARTAFRTLSVRIAVPALRIEVPNAAPIREARRNRDAGIDLYRSDLAQFVEQGKDNIVPVDRLV